MLFFLYALILLAVLGLVMARWRWPQVPLGWPISALTGLVLWFAVFLARPAVAVEIRWFPWLPRGWAQMWGLMGAWDPLRWGLLLVGATWMAAAVLAEAPWTAERSPSTRDWILWWLAVGVGFWVLFPKSPGGLWWAWVVADLVALALALFVWKREGIRLTWLWHTAARAITWLAPLYWSLHTGSGALLEPVSLPLLRPLLLMFLLWRLWWAGPVHPSPRADFWRRGGRLLPLWLVVGSTLPAIHALASWPPPLEVPLGVQGAFWLLGFLMVWTGLARWLTAPSRAAGLPGLVALWSWPALMAAWFGLPQAALFWAAVAWLVAVGPALYRMPERRLLPLWVLLFLPLSLWPWTAGQGGVALWTQAPWWAGLWAGLVVVFSLPRLVSGEMLGGKALAGQPRWIQVFYPLGLGVLVVGLWRWGWSFEAVPADWRVWLPGPGMLASAALLGFLLWRKRRELERWGTAVARPLHFFTGQAVAFYHGMVSLIESTLYFLSLVFEGESGLMWALAFLAAAALFWMR